MQPSQSLPDYLASCLIPSNPSSPLSSFLPLVLPASLQSPPVMETRGSKFTKFQEARLQEMADEVC